MFHFILCVNGQVITKSYDAEGFGNYIIIKDNTTNYGFLYAHLKEPSIKNVGDTVRIGEQVGIEGETRLCNRNSFTFRNARFEQQKLDISGK